MVAVSSNIEDRNLQFSASSLINNSSGWVISSGTGTIGATLVIDDDSTASLSLSNVNKKVTYLKIVTAMTSDDTSLSTDGMKNVAVVVKITYTDSSVKPTTEIFYPSYAFEDNPETYTIVQLSGDKISSIDIDIINSEESTIKITETGLYTILVADSNDIVEVIQENYYEDPTDFNNFMNDYLNNDTTVGDYVSDYLEDNPTTGILIPYEPSVPAAGSRPAGYICRLF
jgi:hypothetical protein